MDIDLYPTPTRLGLLRLVEAGVVRWDPTTGRAYDAIGGRTLTEQVKEAGRAAWVSMPDEPGPVLLAGLGADVLAEADR